MEKIFIHKNDGEQVEFNEKTFIRSLKQAGAKPFDIDDVLKDVKVNLQNGDTTQQVYKNAFESLKTKNTKAAMLYSLKDAIRHLGPSGFPFEQYIAEIYRRQGYEVETNQMIKGDCVEHEIDVLVRKNGKSLAMEVKFKNDFQTRVDLKTALYVKSRVDDLTGKNRSQFFGKKGAVDRSLLITNAKFTQNVINYAKCCRFDIIGWGYPRKGNLRDMILKTHTHPITCLPGLKKSEAKMFFELDIVTCKDFFEKIDTIKQIKKERKDELFKFAKELCSS